MSTDATSAGRSGSVLGGLLAPLRLPERVLEALGELRSMHMELIRVRCQIAPLDDLLPTLDRLEDVLADRLVSVHDVVVSLEGEDSHLNRSITDLPQGGGPL